MTADLTVAEWIDELSKLGCEVSFQKIKGKEVCRIRTPVDNSPGSEFEDILRLVAKGPTRLSAGNSYRRTCI